MYVNCKSCVVHFITTLNMHSNIKHFAACLVYSRPRLGCCLSAGARSGRGFPFVKICYQNQPRIQPAQHSLCAGSGVVARAPGSSHWYFQKYNTYGFYTIQTYQQNVFTWSLGSLSMHKLPPPAPAAICNQWWFSRQLVEMKDSMLRIQRTVFSEYCTWKKSRRSRTPELQRSL